MNTSKIYKVFKAKVRRDLGNQNSLVNRAHMKRPWVYVFFTSSTTWVILSLMSFCVCSFLFGVHLNYKVSGEFQGLSSSNCNFQGILRPWIFNLKFKDLRANPENYNVCWKTKQWSVTFFLIRHSAYCVSMNSPRCPALNSSFFACSYVVFSLTERVTVPYKR